MKIKLEARWIVGSFIVSYIAYIVILAVLGLPNPVYKSSPQYFRYDNDLKPIDAIIPDSISYRKYSDLKDSINFIRDLKDADYFPNVGINFSNLIATGSSIECDTCSLKWLKKTYLLDKYDKPLKELYYVQLPSWKLNDKTEGNIWWTKDSVQFYVEHNQAYVRKFIANMSTIKVTDELLYLMVDVPVKFRYNKKDHCVMIPVSKSVRNSVNIILGIFGILFTVYLLVLIGNFIGFLMDLSKGLAFTNKNIRTLKYIAITLLAIPIAELILTLLLRLIFLSYLTSDVVLNISTLDAYWKFLTIGIISLMIYGAFRQGKILKEEQELTV